MRVLILGSGGREHAIGLKISGSSLLDATFFAPGNAGTEELGTNVPLDPMDFDAVAACVLEYGIDMLVVGPEAPLVEGIVDFFAADERLSNVSVIGPPKAGAALEGSKKFAKEFMHKHRIPTAKYGVFGKGEVRDALAFLKSMKPPYVVKASGLAAGPSPDQSRPTQYSAAISARPMRSPKQPTLRMCLHFPRRRPRPVAASPIVRPERSRDAQGG